MAWQDEDFGYDHNLELKGLYASANLKKKKKRFLRSRILPLEAWQVQRVPQSIQRCFTPGGRKKSQWCRLVSASTFVGPLIQMARLSSLSPDHDSISSNFLFRNLDSVRPYLQYMKHPFRCVAMNERPRTIFGTPSLFYISHTESDG